MAQHGHPAEYAASGLKVLVCQHIEAKLKPEAVARRQRIA
jgi:hypothetical protein